MKKAKSRTFKLNINGRAFNAKAKRDFTFKTRVNGFAQTVTVETITSIRKVK